MGTESLYTDGGVVGRNGYAKAGVWAWVLVEGERIIREDSGFITLEEVVPYTQVTNNVTELYAVVKALEAMPEGWSGHLYSDSDNALKRVFNKSAMNNVPEHLFIRARRCLRRLGKVSHNLLAGHPERYSEQERRDGYTNDGKMLSKWNARCDKACNDKKQEAGEFLRIGDTLYECQESEGSESLRCNEAATCTDAAPGEPGGVPWSIGGGVLCQITIGSEEAIPALLRRGSSGGILYHQSIPGISEGANHLSGEEGTR